MEHYVSIKKYVVSIIDDDLALENLYCTLRKKISSNGFCLKGVNKIMIRKPDSAENVEINIASFLTCKKCCIALLMSLRALIISKDLIKYCKSDKLLFSDSFGNAYEWIACLSFIRDFYVDPDFSQLTTIFMQLFKEGCVTNDMISQFFEHTRNLTFNLTENTASDFREALQKGGDSCSLPYHAYYKDADLEKCVINKDIKYVGNAAFYRCDNLREIILKGADIHFGSAPIYRCSKLKKIIVPGGLLELYSQRLPAFSHLLKEDCRIRLTKSTAVAVDNAKKNLPLSKEGVITALIHHLLSGQPNTYPYFWILSLLRSVKMKNSQILEKKAICSEMLTQSYFLVNKHISYGENDATHDAIQILSILTPLHGRESRRSLSDKIYNHLDNRYMQRYMDLTLPLPEKISQRWNECVNLLRYQNLIEDSIPYGSEFSHLAPTSVKISDRWYNYLKENNALFTQAVYKELETFLTVYNGSNLCKHFDALERW